MSYRVYRLAAGLAALVVALPLAAQGPGPAPEWKHGLELQVRKAGEEHFTKDTKKYSAEVFLDKNVNQLVYMAETASLALAPGSAAPASADIKAPVWNHALELRVRKAGENEFTKDTKKYGIEVFKDVNTNQLVYVCETGSVAVVAVGSAAKPDPQKIKPPAWSHALELRVRKAGEQDFTDKTKKYGLEVYKDDNANTLVYVGENGALAVVPAGSHSVPDKVKAPTWYHALELRVRKAAEPEFNKDTKKYGVEAYRDDNASTLLYLTETGAMAVTPLGTLAAPKEVKAPDWKYGRAFRVRKAGEADFNDKTQKFGAEVYADVNSGQLVYITESGTIAVAPGK